MSRQTTGQISVVTDPDLKTAALPPTSPALWARLRQEAEDAFARERTLSPLFVNSILNRSNFEDAVIHRVAARLGNDVVPSSSIIDAFSEALADDPSIAVAFRFDGRPDARQVRVDVGARMRCMWR